jgi:ABC-type nitrate/sulfonate/bicarbonate transport system substrate-binding protein
MAWLGTVDTLDHPEFELELTDFKSSSDTLVSLTNGSIEIGAVGYNVLADGLANADIPVEYITGASTQSAVVIVNPDAGIDGWEDLAGKRIGGVRGSAEYIHLSGAMRSHGLDLEKDAEFVNFQSGSDIILALQRGDIDATVTYEPLASEAVVGGFGERVPAMQETLFSNSFEVSSGILASSKFLEEHPDWAKAILTQYKEMVETLQDDPERALEIYQKYAAGNPDVLKEALGNVVMTYQLDEEQIRQVAATLHEAGQLNKDMGDELVDHLNYDLLSEATGESPAELGKSE